MTDDVAFRSLKRPTDQLRKLWTNSDGYGLAMMVFELTRSTANSKLSVQFTDKSFRPAAETSGHLRVIQSSDETSWPMMRPRLQWNWLLTSNEWWTGKRPLDRQQAVQSTNMDSEQVADQFYSINLRTTNKAVWQVMTALGITKSVCTSWAVFGQCWPILDF